MRPEQRRWPLLAIGTPAFVAVWSGWVGLGEKTGFGVVHPLPGIHDEFTINSAITLPFGGEAFAIYALHLATHRATNARARRFAWRASIAGLALGWLGQVAYHLMEAGGVRHAPWWITVFVAGLPVLVVGAAAYLWHLAGQDDEAEASPPPEAEATGHEAQGEASPEPEARGNEAGQEATPEGEAPEAQAQDEATGEAEDEAQPEAVPPAPPRQQAGPSLQDVMDAIEAGQIPSPSRNHLKAHFKIGSKKADALIEEYRARETETLQAIG